MDAALQAGIANEDLFPKRGKEVNYTVNGVAKVERGLPGESAVITMNGKPASINTRLEPNSEIEICPSTVGADAMITIEQLEEYHTSTNIIYHSKSSQENLQTQRYALAQQTKHSQ